jgi:hypothetical protein
LYLVKFYQEVPFWGLIVMKDAFKEVVFTRLEKKQFFGGNLKSILMKRNAQKLN